MHNSVVVCYHLLGEKGRYKCKIFESAEIISGRIYKKLLTLQGGCSTWEIVRLSYLYIIKIIYWIIYHSLLAVVHTKCYLCHILNVYMYLALVWTFFSTDLPLQSLNGTALFQLFIIQFLTFKNSYYGKFSFFTLFFFLKDFLTIPLFLLFPKQLNCLFVKDPFSQYILGIWLKSFKIYTLFFLPSFYKYSLSICSVSDTIIHAGNKWTSQWTSQTRSLLLRSLHFSL